MNGDNLEPSGPAGGPDRIGVATIDGEEIVALKYDERVFALRDLVGGDAPQTTLQLIESWQQLSTELGDPGSAAEIGPGGLEWAAPIRPRKLLCVGANYRDHVAELERAGGPRAVRSSFPFSFMKPPSTAIVAGGEPVAIPPYAEKLDWEAELGVVIGDPARAEGDPLGAVFGYLVLNELSLRDFVAPFAHPMGLDAVVSKSFDGSAPMGPWITRADRIGDPSSLAIELRVNGEVRQRSSTSQMIFSVAQLISHYARVLTLEVGDVIATGTPAGVGMAMQPPRFLQSGDEVEVEIEGLGLLRTPIAGPNRSVSLTID